MLCYGAEPSDVVGLANCLLAHWSFNYTAYYGLHYALGAAGVLMPILSTILSDVENRNVRRLITGLSAASVSLYAFLSPLDKVTTYKSAHTELRQAMLLFDQLQKNPASKTDEYGMTFGNTMMLSAVIQTIEDRILNSEKSTKQDAQAAQKAATDKTVLEKDGAGPLAQSTEIR